MTALGFYSIFGSLESLLNLEQKHEMVTAISVEVFPGVLQTEQKHIGNWREAIEAEMNIRHSETYRRPSGARYLVGSTLAPMCKSRYPVHFVAVDVKSTRTIVDRAFSVPKCVRIARMSEKSYELLCKMFSAIPERTKEELESTLAKKFMGYVSGNFSDFERQKQRGSTVTDYNTVDENDEVHRVMKPGAFDKEWAELNLAPMRMRGRAELPEASLNLRSVKPELTVGGTLQTRTFLAPFGYEEIKIVYGEEEDQSARKANHTEVSGRGQN